MGLNPIALRKAKIVYNFGLSECNRVNLFSCIDTSLQLSTTFAKGNNFCNFLFV